MAAVPVGGVAAVAGPAQRKPGWGCGKDFLTRVAFNWAQRTRSRSTGLRRAGTQGVIMSDKTYRFLVLSLMIVTILVTIMVA